MTRTEEFKVSGEDVLKRIKDLIEEGNIRRITIKNKEGRSIAEFPLTVGVIGAVILPPLAAIGTIIALVSECTIAVEKEEGKVEEEPAHTKKARREEKENETGATV